MVFLVAFGAMAMGALLIVLIARYGTPTRGYPLRSVPGGDAMPYDEFRALIIDLLEKLGLDVVFVSGNAQEVDIIARTRTALIAGKYIIHGHIAPPEDRVSAAEVLKLQDQVKGEGASKGILMTPYFIERNGVASLDIELELVDGKRFRQLIEQHLPDKLDQLAKFRGFGL